ncbi:hypothetical protein GmHk_12G035007 [Glycine max]|nr:hypothetical protein GmHk_12G035007 [Glycine max]
MEEKKKKKVEEAAQSGSTDIVVDPPFPIRRHVKWKMACTKKTGQMTSEVAKEIADKLDSLEEQASQGSFVSHGCQDVQTATIAQPKHPCRVRVVGADVMIKQYFGPAPRTSCTSSSMALEDLEQLTYQLEEPIIEKVTRQLMLSFNQMQSQFQSQMQSQGLTLPFEPEVGPSAARVSTKESCVGPSRNDPDTGNSDKCGLYVEENPPHLVTLGRLYEGSTIVNNISLLHDQVKVGVEEVRDADAPIPVPTEEGVVGPAKPSDRPDHDVNDPLYLMTLTIPQLFLKPLQVMWDDIVFGVFNDNFPLYIKYEDLSEIAHGGQCLRISIIQLHMTKKSMRAGNVDVYGFLEPQSIQRYGQLQFESESYIKNWMQKLKRDVYLGAYLNGALKGLDDTPQSKSKAGVRWIVVKYFNDARPLEPERLKAFRIQWTKYYFKVKNET